MAITEKEIEQLLSGLDGPGDDGIKADTLIDGINIDNAQVIVTLAVDPSMGSALEGFRQSVERRLNKDQRVDQATVILTAEKLPETSKSPSSQSPSSPPQSGPSSGKSPVSGPGSSPKSKEDILPGVTRMIAVASGKGGVGKSTVAVNLAASLSTAGRTVGILDADIYGPSVPTMLGLADERLDQSGLAEDGKPLSPKSAHGIQAMSIGFLIDPESPLVWRGPMIQKALFQLMRDVDWGDLDTLIVDLPPGTGDAQLTLAQKAPLTGAVIVTTPQEVAMIDAVKAVGMFEKVDVPVTGFVINMARFHCPDCGSSHDIFGPVDQSAMESRLGIPCLGQLPMDTALRMASDTGTPLPISHPDHEITNIFEQIVAKLGSC